MPSCVFLPLNFSENSIHIAFEKSISYKICQDDDVFGLYIYPYSSPFSFVSTGEYIGIVLPKVKLSGISVNCTLTIESNN